MNATRADGQPGAARRPGPVPPLGRASWPGPAPWPDAAAPPDPAPLPGTPWSVRLARGPGTRPALEIYEAADLIGVIVATPVAPQILRGARGAARRGQPFGLAWGRIPAEDPAITVAFAGGWLRRMACRAEVTEIGGWCWLAVAAGRFAAVTVSHRGGRQRLRLRTGSSR